MLSTRLFVCCLCLAFLTRGNAYITDQISPLSESMWEKVSAGLTLVASSHLAAFFLRYNNESSTLALEENDFLSGGVSWLTDFGDILDEADQIKQSKAYFRTLDVILEVFSRRLTISDMDELIDICEKASGSGGSGVLDRKQFVNGFERVVFRSIPFSYMFVTYNTFSWVLQPFENLNDTEFMNIFKDIDTNNDDLLDEYEMAEFWEAGNYDVGESGRNLFKKLDYQNHGSLTVDDWIALMGDINCRPVLGLESVDVQEFFQLDLILADRREYPSDECILGRS